MSPNLDSEGELIYHHSYASKTTKQKTGLFKYIK